MNCAFRTSFSFCKVCRLISKNNNNIIVNIVKSRCLMDAKWSRGRKKLNIWGTRERMLAWTWGLGIQRCLGGSGKSGQDHVGRVYGEKAYRAKLRTLVMTSIWKYRRAGPRNGITRQIEGKPGESSVRETKERWWNHQRWRPCRGPLRKELKAVAWI